jgi:hypothetical protein
MSEDMSDRMPEDLPVRKCINVKVGITRSKVFFFNGIIHCNESISIIEAVCSNNAGFFGSLLREASLAKCAFSKGAVFFKKEHIKTTGSQQENKVL